MKRTLRTVLGSALIFAAVLATGPAFAERGDDSGSSSTTTTCTPDTTVTTSTPYTVCTPYQVTTNLGYNACNVGGNRATNSGDFAMDGSCAEATQTTTEQNCTVAYNTTTSVVKGVCTTKTTVSPGGGSQAGNDHGGG